MNKVVSFVVCISGAVLAAPVWAEPVAMAARVVGDVRVEHGGKTQPLRLLGRLEEGDAVRCGPNSSAGIVLFGNGTRYQLDAGQRGVVHASSVAGAKALPAMAGPSANVVKLLGGARVGAVLARPATALQRLTPDSPGWLEGERPRFSWLPEAGAATYTFTLFDPYDNVVWSVSTALTSADYPADAPVLNQKRSYLWRVSAFGASGKPLPNTRCGLITFLSSEDAAQLRGLAAQLQNQAQTENSNLPLLMLAETYRSYGVTGRTLEVLEDERVRTEPGVAQAKEDVYATLSPFARVQAGQTVTLERP